jgi:riboflavin synthase
VDGKGRVRKKKALKSSTVMEIDIPGALSPYLVEKGSISVDGVSLTIVSVQKNRFSVSLLPFTLKETTLGVRGVGDEVNIETDILSKHIHNLVKSNF